MATAYFLAPTQVQIDPQKPVPNWSLSRFGRGRLAASLDATWHANIGEIWSSTEIAALETAEAFAAPKRLDVQTFVQLGEVDHGSTGYLEQEAFEQARINFFQRPNDSYKGWETARDAQKRIMRAIKLALLRHDGQDILICGHSDVGALLLAALSDQPISIETAPALEGGQVFAFDLSSNELLFNWVSLESLSTISAVA